MITIPENLSPPVLIAVGVGALILLLLIVRAFSSSGSSAKQKAAMIAAVQTERDTLRANHAVEVATLEHKLNEARDRLNENMESVLAAKDSERRIAALSETVNALRTKLDEQDQRAARLEVERDAVLGGNRDPDRLAAERDVAQRKVEEQSETISSLRRELQEAVNRATHAVSARAERTEEVEDLKAQRDRLNNDIERQAETISRLRTDLQAAISSASRTTTVVGSVEAAIAERNEAQTTAEQYKAQNQSLRGELQDVAARLAAAGETAERVQHINEELEAARDNEARVRKQLREREVTITELRTALMQRDGSGDAAGAALESAVSEAREREHEANAEIKRLSGERDEAKAQVSEAENTVATVRVELAQKAAQLELRDQSIAELKAEAHKGETALREARHRAEQAEAQLATAPGGDIAVTANATVARVQAELDTLRAENEALRERAASAVGESDVAALREQLRSLADRFLSGAEGGEAQDAATSLAARIRAFKAARAAGIDPGKR